MHLQVPLKDLRFGHEAPHHPGNARVTGRLDGIPTLAAHIHSRGKIDDLLVYDDGMPPLYFVANGNRSLAALRMIYGEESSELVDCKLTTAERAYEDSLAVAVLATKFHPVDEYEAYAKLRDEQDKSEEEIALQYGMNEKQVRQVLALGRLSPKIRQSWRAGDIKAEVARSFTLALDHATQDRVFDKLKNEGHLAEGLVKKELGAFDIDADVAKLLDVVGADAYRNAGGVVTEDLFGSAHIISDENLLKQMTRQLLIAKCEELQTVGWGWAEIASDLPHGAQFWPESQPKSMSYRDDEKSRLDTAKAEFEVLTDTVTDLTYNEREELQEKLSREIEEITSTVRSRSFDIKKMKSLGCIVDVEDGRIVVLYGIKKPAEVKNHASSASSDDENASTATKKGSAKATAIPEEPEISNALLLRLSVQLTKAAATALIQDEQLALSILLAGFGCYSDCGVKVSVSGLGSREGRDVLGSDQMPQALALASRLKPAERITLLTQIAANALDFQNTSMAENDSAHRGPVAIVNAIDAKALNAALRGSFDAKDYFTGVNKALCLKAIEEAMGADMARQQSKNPKSDIAAFAIENVPTTGWLPLQLRAKGYDGPPIARAKLGAARKSAAKPKSADRKKKPVKKPAAPKKAAKKTVAKKRKAA